MTKIFHKHCARTFTSKDKIYKKVASRNQTIIIVQISYKINKVVGVRQFCFIVNQICTSTDDYYYHFNCSRISSGYKTQLLEPKVRFR